MESPANPYSTPAANLFGSPVVSSETTVSPSTIAQLTGTKPWVRFISVLMWIGTVVIIIAAVFILIAAATGLRANPGKDAAYNFGFLAGMGIYYSILSFTFIYPALKLGKYASCIGRLASTRSLADLDAALTEQRRYWKFYGVLIIVGVCLALIGLIAVMAFGVTAAMKSGAFPLR